MSSQEFLDHLMSIISVGSIYALLAIGLAMVLSIVGLINFAHGQLVTVGGYTIYLLSDAGSPFILACVAALAVTAVIAVLMERIAFRPLRGASFATLIFTSFAVGVVIANTLVAVISPRPRSVDVPGGLNQVHSVAGLDIATVTILTVVCCLAALTGLTLFLRRTSTGLAMLAASQDFQATRLMGVPANRVIAYAFAISGALAALAAVFLVARSGSVDPLMGTIPFVKALVASIIGGFGSLTGAAVGGFLLATMEVGFDATLPDDLLPFRDAFVFAIVILVLWARPEGILRRRAEVGA